ncbi:MAG: hypothetical protein NVSMB42_01360 [Herpetosiphon sp.]
MKRCVAILVLACLCVVPRTGQAEETERLFVETGWRVSGRLLRFWDAYGGLPIFGLPLARQHSSPTPSGTFDAQLFERERLELHPENTAPYDVLLGRLGDELLQRGGRDWRVDPAGEPLAGRCRAFSETGRSVCGPFLDYWEAHGLGGEAAPGGPGSLALFGLPLTDPHRERNSSGDLVLTQWFERARFELHPGLTPPVLLGRLGAESAGDVSVALPTLDAAITPLRLLQGHTGQLQVVDANFTALRATLGSTALPVIHSNGVWRALAGVPVTAAPGPLALHIEAELADGRTVVQQRTVTVLDARYPREEINLPPEVNASLDKNRDAIVRENRAVRAIWSQVTPTRLWDDTFIAPAEGEISSEFGTLRSYNGGPYDSFHEGLDIANRTGTPIVAPARGRVVFAETDLVVRGGAVILDHGWGVHTGFWHQSAVLVKIGDIVERGQIIGRMGAKGLVTGPHVHWDVRIGSTNVSPHEWTETAFPR